MFFISNSLAETLQKTLIDMVYAKKNARPIVLIHPRLYKDLMDTNCTTEFVQYGVKMEQDREVDDGTSWKMGDVNIKFIRSYDTFPDKVLIFLEEQVTTITYQKQN